jgi:predicted nuclease of predicted toxin-antitoxin system
MRILLDECLPKDLAKELFGHEVKTVPQAGWSSISNGKLLKLIATTRNFEIFLTMDKNLPHQNKIQNLPFAIIVLRAQSNRVPHVLPFAPEILRRLSEFQRGQVYFLTSPVS